ncbi:MAG: glycosyltransferase [Saprospiraceae bacterium]|nr:glycosyltransferase [Saprospiraceae bacterium]
MCVTVSDQIIIVDSFSKDNTVNISKNLGAVVYQNPFVNQAKQFQWALDNVIIKNDWILRIDADEYLTSDLTLEIKINYPAFQIPLPVFTSKEGAHFMGQWIETWGLLPNIFTAFVEKRGRINRAAMDGRTCYTESWGHYFNGP